MSVSSCSGKQELNIDFKSIKDVFDFMSAYKVNESLEPDEVYLRCTCHSCQVKLPLENERFWVCPYLLPDLLLCDSCKQRNEPGVFKPDSIVRTCDYKHKQFRVLRTASEDVACQPFEAKQGWYVNLPLGQDLCLRHGELFNQSSDLRQLGFQRFYNLTETLQAVEAHDTFFGDPSVFVLDTPNRSSMKLPPILARSARWRHRMIRLAIEWCSLEEIHDRRDFQAPVRRQHNSLNPENKRSWYWQRLQHLHHCIDDPWLLSGVRCSPEFGSIRMWLPFDYSSSRNAPLVDDARNIWALVNCDASNKSLFGRVAMAVLDEQGRLGVDMTDLKVDEYLSRKHQLVSWLAKILPALPIVLMEQVTEYAENSRQFLVDLRLSLSGQRFWFGYL